MKKWYHDEAFKKFHDGMVEEFKAFDPSAPVVKWHLDGLNPGPVVGPESLLAVDSMKGQETQQARNFHMIIGTYTYAF